VAEVDCEDQDYEDEEDVEFLRLVVRGEGEAEVCGLR
jgi:hypothetical protein